MNTAQTILVTGVNGFVGPHLVRDLRQHGIKVIGLGNSDTPLPELSGLLETYWGCDLTDEAAVKALDFSKITSVIHLAGLSSPSLSFAEPQKFISANSAMLINLFEGILAQKEKNLPRFVVVSSSTVYDPEQPMPITEKSDIASTSPYAVSKLLNENLCGYYRKRGFECVIARPFNHTGPGQGMGFIIPDFTHNILKAGPRGIVPVGNMKAKRDYSDARDVVRAYTAIATAKKLHHHTYNIASGNSYSGEEIFAIIREAAFGEEATTTHKPDPAKVRPYEGPDIFVDISLAKKDLKWEPRFHLEQTVRDYVQWVRQEVQ